MQFKLAEMKTEVESLRALTYRACELYVQGQDVTELASMAKLKAGRLNRIIPEGCLQFWGGMGYTATGGLRPSAAGLTRSCWASLRKSWALPRNHSNHDPTHRSCVRC